jgi:hypothetical protein
MERELSTARELDPAFDYAGPDRSLGMLYLEAPVWPASIGNRTKSRSHLEAAVELCPGYMENHLCLAQAYAKWDESKNLEREMKAIHQLEPEAESHFPRDRWEASWRDWDAQIKKLQKAQDQYASKPKASPAERGARRK